MNNTTNKTEPLLTDNPIIVLSDGETFDGLEGSMIAFAPEGMDTDEIEEALREDSLDTFALGSLNDWEMKDVLKVIQMIVIDRTIQLDEETQTITIK